MARLAASLAGTAYAKTHDAGGSVHPAGTLPPLVDAYVLCDSAAQLFFTSSLSSPRPPPCSLATLQTT